ncbi:hypothetical protein AALI21_02825 [Corynebacteriaceae bacterium 6-324]
MDDLLCQELERALVSVIRLAPELDELLVPRQASSGENAGKPPTKGKSKPPIDVSFLDLKLDTLKALERMCILLHDDFPELKPVKKHEIVPRAEWLLGYLEELAGQSWAARCAEQVIAQVHLVDDVIAPPVSLSDPVPIEVGPVREIVRWAQWLNRDVSRTTVQRWVKMGVIESELRPDGTVMIRLADVLSHADLRKSLVMGHPC